MSRKVIEIVQVLVDRIEKNGYQQRAREENAFDLNKRLTEAEGWVAHWKQARQEAHEAGELMKAEIETLRTELANAQRELSEQGQTHSVELQQETADLRQQLDAAQPAVTLQRAGIERLQAFVGGIDNLLEQDRFDRRDIAELLIVLRSNSSATLTSSPTPCPECERLQAFVSKVRELLAIPLAQINYVDMSVMRAELAALDDEPTPATEPLDAEGGA